ncbi:hypothetical protein cyc_08686 [Cyclospora cayetanensis]|uniref:RNA-editing substrate-binding complex 6 protein domain-containing protein n=1 Tax=Cyclospora cayetanensis TaxID=88456 RepID=A0A1D3CU00_9EIME|nr:hypothetical protein cyc_08686 [Cyclospora cayetanensis]
MDPINVVTGVHRLGRLLSPYNRGLLFSDPRFVSLMAAARESLPLLDCQGVSNLLWGLTRAEHTPAWLPQLLSRCAALSHDMSPHQVATCLYCLGRLALPAATAEELREALLEASFAVVPQLQRPLDLTCICCGLSRLRVKDSRLFGALAVRARALLPQLSTPELASVAWAFAASAFFDKSLAAAIRRRVETDAELCSPGDAVQFAWALARMAEEPVDLFNYTLTPIIRGCLPQLNARQLATLVSAYAQAGVQDRDLLSDLSVSLLPHLSACTAQQLATVAVGFAVLGFSNKEFMGALGQKVLSRLPTFSDRQLARTVYGLGVAGCLDTRVLDGCCSRLQERLHALPPEGLAQALVGLSEAEYLSHRVVPQLLKAVGKKVESLFAEDCVQLLLLLSKLGACAALPAEDRLLVRTHIHRRLKVQAALSTHLEKLSAMAALDPDSTAALLFACAQLGFADDAVLKMAGGLQHKVEMEGELLSLISLCHFLWANTEMHISLGWTRSVLRYMLTRRYGETETPSFSGVSLLAPKEREMFSAAHALGGYRGGEVLPRLLCAGGEASAKKGNPQDEDEGKEEERVQDAAGKTALAESLLRAAFSCVSLGEEDHLLPLMEEVASLYGNRLPSDLLLAQQVSLHVSRFAGPPLAGEPRRPSPQLREWLSLVLGAPRYDVYHKGAPRNKYGPGTSRLRVKDYNYDAWLSEPLIQMKIPHKVTFVVGGIYRVSAAFPLEKHLIDVLTFQIAAACCPEAARFVSFSPSPSQTQGPPEKAAKQDRSVSAFLLGDTGELEAFPSLQVRLCFAADCRPCRPLSAALLPLLCRSLVELLAQVHVQRGSSRHIPWRCRTQRGKIELLELADDDDTEAQSLPKASRRLQDPLDVSETPSSAPVSPEQSRSLSDRLQRSDAPPPLSAVKAAEPDCTLEADAQETLRAVEALQQIYGHTGNR